MPQVTFDNIDLTNKTPRVAIEYDTKSGILSLPDNAKKLGLIGQRLAAGAVAAAVPTAIFRAGDSEAAFGAGSVLDRMCKAALRANPFAPILAVAMDDAGGGVKAAETATFATTATADGGWEFDIGNDTVSVQVTKGDTPTVQAAALAAAIMAATGLPVTATSALGVTTITAKNKGTLGNGLLVAYRMLGAPGTTVALSNGDGKLSTGAGAADPTAALASIAGIREHDIVVGLDDSTGGTDLRDHVEGDGGPEEGRGEFGFQAVNGALGTITTLAGALASARSLVLGIRGCPTWFPEIAAALGAIVAGQSRIRPYNGLVIPGVKAPSIANRWSKAELKSLIANGVTPLVVLPGDRVAIKRLVTTKVLNDAGNPDFTLLDITTMEALDRTRDALTSMFETIYPRVNWAENDADGLLPPDTATPEKVTESMQQVAFLLEAEGTLKNVAANISKFVVNKVGTNCQFSMPTDTIEGLHEIFGKEVLTRVPLASAAG